MEEVPRLQVVMDIDATMIAATSRIDNIYTDGTFEACGKTFSYRLRPGLERFLEEVSRVADLHIFTTGHADYARAVRDTVDPDHVLFQKVWSFEDSHDQIISRRIYGETWTRAKSLSMVFGHAYNPRRNVLIDECSCHPTSEWRMHTYI